MNRSEQETLWLFGYGSLIWHFDYPYLQRREAMVRGFTRRFWQGSHDHRGVPNAPGRVVTLIEEADAACVGIAYEIDGSVADEIVPSLDHREKNGYAQHQVPLMFLDDAASPRAGPGHSPTTPPTTDALVYIATPSNHAFLGEAPLHDLATQIARSQGPSGHNADYLFALADSLRSLDNKNSTWHADDAHVFALETAVRDALRNPMQANAKIDGAAN